MKPVYVELDGKQVCLIEIFQTFTIVVKYYLFLVSMLHMWYKNSKHTLAGSYKYLFTIPLLLRLSNIYYVSAFFATFR